MDEPQVLVQARHLSKHYYAIKALDDVSIDIRAGEVHALVGSNGAGKSTLIKILTGAIVPDAGQVVVQGQPMMTGDPKVALDTGIACIYQESNLVPALSVLDNIILGRHSTHQFGTFDRKAHRSVVQQLLAKHSLNLDPELPVQTLPSVQQKEVEIAKALSLNARVILMDEPTAWLSQSEVENLFRSIRNLTREGVGVLYISHVLDEIFAIADRVSVLRDGKVLGTTPTAQTTKSQLVEMMLGRQLSAEANELQSERPADQARTVALECRGLSRAGLFKDVNLSVCKGEIVCITGLVGAKRSELVRTLFGAEQPDEGEIWVHGRPVTVDRPLDAIQLGIGLVPEDRRRDGLLMGLTMSDNLATAHLSLVTRFGLISDSRLKNLGRNQMEQLGIVPPRLEMMVRNLSGGNQQKVLVGRWLAGKTDVFILDEPTVGIDVGAKADIYRILRRLANAGAAILAVSSDIEEVMTIADRILVMAKGRLVRDFSRGEVTQAEILRAASGETVK
ncbi:MAG: sugar ABC transporter ATP-binding protein [Chloroflexi bacterium]|nr:sugar ABC transporter ATP-binding protein [Chloroflexota bacterium]